MTADVAFPRARRLRFAGSAALVLWFVTVIGFVILVALHASDRILAALGGLASVLFATSFALQAIATRREWRELAARAAKDDLQAARSRRSMAGGSSPDYWG
jgi:cobalamin biosynthesis protein CobD/CbiB